MSEGPILDDVQMAFVWSDSESTNDLRLTYAYRDVKSGFAFADAREVLEFVMEHKQIPIILGAMYVHWNSQEIQVA